MFRVLGLAIYSRVSFRVWPNSEVHGSQSVVFVPPPWALSAACAAMPRMSTALYADRAHVIGSGGCSLLWLLCRRCHGRWFSPFFYPCRQEFVFWTRLARACLPCAPIFALPFFPCPLIVFKVAAAFSLALPTNSMCSPWVCLSHEAFISSQGGRLLGGLQAFLLWLLLPLCTTRGRV